MRYGIICITAGILILACKNEHGNKNVLMDQVREAEESFNAYAQEKGLAEAFVRYADDDAVLVRNNRVIKGKDSIQAYVSGGSPDITLTWHPDYIEVSDSGDLAYTYGEYRMSRIDSSGQEVSHVGVFHTVWKRQADGSWKYVYD